MTEEVSSKLAEVGQLKGEIADKLFEEADGYVSLPPYLDMQKRDTTVVTRCNN